MYDDFIELVNMHECVLLSSHTRTQHIHIRATAVLHRANVPKNTAEKSTRT